MVYNSTGPLFLSSPKQWSKELKVFFHPLYGLVRLRVTMRPKLIGRKYVSRWKEENLGLTDLAVWNTCLVLKSLWNVCTKKDSIWVEWVQAYQLRQISIWAVPTPVDCSWVWRKLLKLRSILQPFIKQIIGMVMIQIFGMIKWHPMGPPYQHFSGNLLKSFGLTTSDTVTKCIDRCLVDESWLLREECYNYTLLLNLYLPLMRKILLFGCRALQDISLWNLF